MRSARLLLIGSCLLFASVAIADDKTKVIVTDAHSWENAPDLGEAFDEVARFNWVKTQGCPRADEIHSTLREQCGQVQEVGNLEDADYVLVFNDPSSDDVAGFAATTRDLVVRKSESSLTQSIKQACDGITEHWALNRKTMRSGVAPQEERRKSENASATATGTGSVVGVVVDEGGHPMSDAIVYVWRIGLKSQMRPVHTGSDGRFSESSLDWGKYFVSAEKQEAGYTDDHYTSSVLELSSENPRATVTVRLGEKAGVLLLSATDAASGQPVEPAFVQVSSDCPPETRSLAGAGKRFLIPSSREYKLTVSVLGFEPWHYTTGTGSIRLEPAQELRLEVPLKRKSTGTDQLAPRRSTDQKPI